MGHFPISENLVSSFGTLFSNADSFVKYLQHLKKASIIVQHPWIHQDAINAIKMGLTKAKTDRRRSFINGEHTQAICKHLVRRGLEQLSRFCAVAYTYQLRAQSEGIILRSRELSREEMRGDQWFSCVSIGKRATNINLRRRKNKNFQSSISRSCSCSITPYACGKCALDYQTALSRKHMHDKVFWQISNSDIKHVQEAAAALGLPYPTWHGFRRGRTCDLVSAHKEGQNISLEDIFESGGWFSGSRAILHYLRREIVDRERVVGILADLSDSD